MSSVCIRGRTFLAAGTASGKPPRQSVLGVYLAARRPGWEKESDWGRGDSEILESLWAVALVGWMRGSGSVLGRSDMISRMIQLEDETRP